ncbi:MAG: SpoIIE family protein phosphatase [Phycisphaerae bacterium]|nr:SpoIIE family protein phosphatase [Phycisphaerae bacterium]
MPRLEICYRDRRKAVVEVAKSEVIIGRDAACDIPLEDSITSRYHARLYRDEREQYWLEDLHSKNGTLINKKPITTSRVHSGDRISIGACCLTLTTESAPSVVLTDTNSGTLCGNTNCWRADERLELPRQRLERLYELNERLTGRFERDDLLGEVLDVCAESLRFERAGIAVWRGEGQVLEWIRLKDLRGGARELRISRSLVDRALHAAERVLINDTADEQVDPTASMISNNIRSAMCVPMEYHQQVRGVIYGDRVTSTGGYDKEDLDFFAALGRLGAMGLANVQLVEEMHRRQQMEMQLQLGRQIQAHLFPSQPMAEPASSTSPGLKIDALNDPGQEISGDYYDYFRRDDGLVAVVIADVAGKGLPASLPMANLQAAVHLTLTEETDLAHAVDLLNELICRNVADSRFITGIFGLLDPAARIFRYVNAGHPWPYVLRSDERSRAHPGLKPRTSRLVEKPAMRSGLPLGIDPNVVYEPGVIEMTDLPATLFLYTDGIVDAENEQRERFQEQRLVSLLEANAGQPPDQLVTRVRRSIEQFTRNHPQTDDITMVAIRLG